MINGQTNGNSPVANHGMPELIIHINIISFNGKLLGG